MVGMARGEALEASKEETSRAKCCMGGPRHQAAARDPRGAQAAGGAGEGHT